MNGDNSVGKPGLLSGFEARGKWDAWESKKGLSQDDAKAQYVAAVKTILGEWEEWTNAWINT